MLTLRGRFLKNKSGIIKLDGVFHDEKKGDSIISREILFNVEKFSEQGYYFTSQQIRKNPAEKINDGDLADYYPDFLFMKTARQCLPSIAQARILLWAGQQLPYFTVIEIECIVYHHVNAFSSSGAT